MPPGDHPRGLIHDPRLPDPAGANDRIFGTRRPKQPPPSNATELIRRVLDNLEYRVVSNRTRGRFWLIVVGGGILIDYASTSSRRRAEGWVSALREAQDGAGASSSGLGSTPQQLADRPHLLQYNEPAIQLALARLRDAGEDLDVITLVIDARDSIGSEIARAVDPDHRVERIAGDQIPTILLVLPRLTARDLLADTHPRVAARLDWPSPPGTVAVVIAAEGVMVARLPIVEGPSEAGLA